MVIHHLSQFSNVITFTIIPNFRMKTLFINDIRICFYTNFLMLNTEITM